MSSSRDSPPPVAESSAQLAFPTSTEQFDDDPRVSYSRLEQKWILEADDGAQWEYDAATKRWTPSIDEEELRRQQQAYDVGSGEDNGTTSTGRKRRHDETGGGQKKKQRPTERQSTAVYVTSLPEDATKDEIHTVFSRFGVVAEELESTEPRIKIYKDEKGRPKGEALVVYFRPESVQLAIDMLDDTDFRLGQSSASAKMRVMKADPSFKKDRNTLKPGGDETAKPTNKRGPNRTKDQQKAIEKARRMNEKLADWSDDDPQSLPETSSRWDKVVILKHMFTLNEIRSDPAAIIEIKEDVRDECSKLGEVTNTVLFDEEADGIVTVRFSNAEAAQACIRAMHGRNFGGQQVEATIAKGGEKFRKSNNRKGPSHDEDRGEETQDGDAQRLDNFGAWLESGEDNGRS